MDDARKVLLHRRNIFNLGRVLVLALGSQLCARTGWEVKRMAMMPQTDRCMVQSLELSLIFLL